MEQCETEGCGGVAFKQHLCLVCVNKLFDTAISSDASELAKDDLLKNIESALELGNESHCFISTATLCQAQNEIVNLRYQISALPSNESVSSKLNSLIEDWEKEAAFLESDVGGLSDVIRDCIKQLKAALERS